MRITNALGANPHPDDRAPLAAGSGAAGDANLESHPARLAPLRHAGPPVLYIIVFKYWPMYGIQIAFRNFNPIDGITGSPWVGLAHFERFVTSYSFRQVIRQYPPAERLQPGSGVPAPHHPGAGAELHRPRLVPAHGADDRVRAVLHLDGGDGRHHPGHARPALRSH